MVISRTFTSLGAYTSFREHKRLKMYIKKKKPYHTNYSNLIVSSYYTYWYN
ncbi:hypothetical protein JHK85_021115 [Glycine max]|uniref:Uncharacterized protein n=1 Tax=Glycine soja TaxID=3848 RepID=A0A445JAY3_GLYSO|nr:hypothetical protein JHK85_021115 [Glycine max]RZB95655.1 hypothetical protein D0Y65_019832 [Glycine soja]